MVQHLVYVENHGHSFAVYLLANLNIFFSVEQLRHIAITKCQCQKPLLCYPMESAF